MGRNMEDNYLKLFGNMFYNIKEDQDNKKIIDLGQYFEFEQMENEEIIKKYLKNLK